LADARVLLLGGTGAFGSLIADQLAGSNHLTLVGRDAVRGGARAKSIGAEFVSCDLADPDALGRLLAGSLLVINAAGPFRPGHYSIPELSIAAGCHYIDLADDRRYVSRFPELDRAAKSAGVFACTGASTTPAVTYALAAGLCAEAPKIRTLKIALTAGNKNKPGVSTFASILSYAGAPVRVWRGGRWQESTGWGEAESVRFPVIGRRRVQLCDVADLELFPRLFQAEEVVFKAGVELPLFNFALGALAGLRTIFHRINLPRLAGPLVRMSRWFRFFGSYQGAVAVWVTPAEGQPLSLALVAPANGARIPTAPPVLLARKILAGEAPPAGAFPCTGFLSLGELEEYLAPFGIFKVAGDERGWAS
jgi:hypothetical protein